jgi:hypothetical protein
MARISLLLLPALLSGWLACAPSEDVDAWREVSSADGSKTTEGHPPKVASSLGDPFVLVAQARPNVSGTPDPTPATPVDDAWVMLESDACDVVLRSLHTAFVTNDGESVHSVTSVAPSTGVVQDASATQVQSRHQVEVQLDGEGESAKAVATVTLYISGEEPDGLVHVRGTLDVGTEAPALHFEASGLLNETAEAVPERRFGCF